MYEREDYIELAKFPINLSKAIARGIGRLVVEHIEKFVGIEPDLSADEWRTFYDNSIEVDDGAEEMRLAREFTEAFTKPFDE